MKIDTVIKLAIIGGLLYLAFNHWHLLAQIFGWTRWRLYLPIVGCCFAFIAVSGTIGGIYNLISTIREKRKNNEIKISSIVYIIFGFYIVAHTVSLVGDIIGLVSNAYYVYHAIGLLYSAIMVLCYLAMLGESKTGYWVLIGATCIKETVFAVMDGNYAGCIISCILLILTVSAVLLIRKNGISAFRAMGINIG